MKEHDVELIGASAAAIDKAEDRELFRDAMTRSARDGALAPCRQSGGRAGGARRDRPAGHHPALVHARRHGRGHRLQQAGVHRHRRGGLDASPTTQVLVEESVLGWKEFEMEVVRDKADNCIIICSIENIDPMGVHTGRFSITVAPALTLTDKEFQIMRDASIAVLREIGVETGGSNVQFAVNPADGRMVVIEMNPRVSRSSALASKATGFPIAKVAAKLAVGYTLDEIANDITGGATPASFEPTIDYIVTKIPRFAFEKFPGAEPIADNGDEVGRRSDGDRPHVRLRSLQKALALAGNGPRRARRDRDRARLGARRRPRHVAGAPRSASQRPIACSTWRRRCAWGWAIDEIHECVQDRPLVSSSGSPEIIDARSEGARPRSAGRTRATCAALKASRLLRRPACRSHPGKDRGGRRRRPRRKRLGVTAGVQAHRHLRGRVRFPHGLHVLDLRGAVRRQAPVCEAEPVGARKDRHPRRRPESDRAGDRV